jgi:hypothetical protein
MTREDIILMADASGLSFYGMGKDRDKFLHYLEAFANLVAAAEREVCAGITENWRCNGFPRTVLADQIRARGQG